MASSSTVASVPGLTFDCACFVIHLPRLAPRLAKFKVGGETFFFFASLHSIPSYNQPLATTTKTTTTLAVLTPRLTSGPFSLSLPLSLSLSPPSFARQAAAGKAGLSRYEIIEGIDAKVREQR